ncbi:uncharacterized abhydrolase domain-containing protein DDB_G0269086-like [Schistocerca piceifrons]|uniref:uncharacterized abhydrolase domain-containing protein DDB_G0269086-like n=1 Tax=Schistocerca piceifrons TaxID=274613 RepID=UPI001F5FAA06|nr:uncharacterized abhydrolase domain-containing protein DDB_G0269086-like [Schistocerca piceifrons]
MDTEEQPLVSAGNVEMGALSSTSTLFEDIPCENVGAGAQEVVPPPTSAQGEVDKEIAPPPEKQEPESGNLPGGYSLQAILERVLDYQAKFAQQQAEKDEKIEIFLAQQAETDRQQAERDRRQAERDRQLTENLLAQQAERDRQQAERDRQLTENLLAQQAERDRQQAERDQQLVQSLENMKKEIACMKQNYESIPKAVQELTVQVNNLQVANTNRVDEIGVLANRVEKLEIDSTQLVEQKWNEQATKIETEFNSWLEAKESEIDKNINSKFRIILVKSVDNMATDALSRMIDNQDQNEQVPEGDGKLPYEINAILAEYPILVYRIETYQNRDSEIELVINKGKESCTYLLKKEHFHCQKWGETQARIVDPAAAAISPLHYFHVSPIGGTPDCLKLGRKLRNILFGQVWTRT